MTKVHIQADYVGGDLQIEDLGPDEKLIVMRNDEFRVWKTRLVMLSVTFAAMGCLLGVIIGYLVWGWPA